MLFPSEGFPSDKLTILLQNYCVTIQCFRDVLGGTKMRIVIQPNLIYCADMSLPNESFN